jgi:hypothetical protein
VSVSDFGTGVTLGVGAVVIVVVSQELDGVSSFMEPGNSIA